MKKKLKIAIFTDTFLPQINGVVTSILNLAKGLADNGHKVFIFAPKFVKKEDFHYPGVVVRRSHSVPAYFYEDFKATMPFSPVSMQYLVKNKVDVIHAQTPITMGFQAVIAAKTLSLPLVGTFHTFFADPEYLKHGKLNNKIGQKLIQEYSNFFLNRCDLVTSPSQKTKKELLSHGCKKKIKVISNGIDMKQFDNSKAETIKQKYNPDGPLVLFIGRIAHEKNINQLVDIFNFVVKDVSNAKLLLVGKGPQEKDVKAKIKKRGLSKNIILAGAIPHDELVKSGIFGACDLFITASKTENQPMTILESQANGLVCLGLNVRGIPDLIKNGKNGYVFEPEDKKGFAQGIIKLLKDKELLSKMKKATLEEVKHHHLKNVIREWERVYQGLIKK